MNEATRLRLIELSRRDGVDAVIWREPPLDPVILVADDRQDLRDRFQAIGNALLEMATHLPEPTAIVQIAKHNVRLHTGPDLTVIVFLETGHSTAKSLMRTLRRVVTGSSRRPPIVAAEATA